MAELGGGTGTGTSTGTATGAGTGGRGADREPVAGAGRAAGAAADREALLARLLAKEAIREVLARYVRGVDRADEALLRSCYFDDAIEEHGSSWNGPAQGYVTAAMPKVRAMGTMQHLLAPSHFEFAGDALCHVETMIWTFARFAKDGRDWDTFTGGRLHDRFECRAGEWRIAHRRTIFDWNRDVPSAEGWCLGYIDVNAPGVRRGRKDGADPSYEKF